MTIPKLQDFRSDRATYVAGQAAIVTASFDAAVFVDTFGGFRVPVLVLSNGARAYYIGGSGTDELRFQYNILDTDRSALDLTVVAFAENDATIRSAPSANAPGDDADVTVRFNDVGGSLANNDILTPSSIGDVSVQTRSLSTGADLVNPKIASMSSVAGTYGVGTTLDIVVSFDEVVLVRTSGGVPTLQFAGGGNVLEGFAASYVGGSGTKKLTFRVEIAEGMPTASGLDVIDLALKGGSITDLSGNNANLGITIGTNNLAPYADIQVVGSSSSTGGGETQPGGDGSADVTAAVIESVQSIKGDGPFDVGDRVDLKVTLSEAVTLNTLLGSPVLALSNGGMAQYLSGSGTRELLFRYTVKASDRNSQDLDVIGVAENDASIVDAAGNRTDVRINADNRLAKFGNVVIDAQAPYLRSVDAADDTYIVGDTITFTGTFSEAVSVTGTPGLNLSNGGVAQYVSGSGSSLLVFKYDVAGGSQSSADLDVLSLNITNGAFKSAVTGNAATVQVTPGILSFDADVLIDTSRPSGTISLDKTSLIANETASVTVSFDEPVADPRSAIGVLNGTLSDLVTAETGDTGRVWTGTFTPALGVEDATNALVLDNTKVFDDAGNAGIGLSASANFLIDTRGPSPVVSSVAQADGSRLLTLDFGEPITDLSDNGLVVTNGVKGELSKLSDSKYTLSVTPEVSNPSGVIGLSLADNHIKDALGNFNDPFSASFVWDETSPVIEEITSPSASYTTGDAIDIRVRFSEAVEVNPISGDASLNPVLALSNGRVAAYQGGSGTNTLTFRYIVQSGDEASDLDSLALIENAGRIHDASGNDAQVRITSGLNNLAFATNIIIDGVVPSITNVSAADGLYQAGDEVLLDVQFSEDVVLDRTGGDPILALSNGSYASFVSHDGDRMVFSYAVTTGDNDEQDLDVLGFAENGSALVDASGNRANVAIRFGINNLAERNEVNIDAARPQIAETSANAGEYKAGQQIEIALAMSKGVVVDTTQGDPSLKLNNGREAIFDAEASTPTKLVFVYDVLATDILDSTGTLLEEYDLSIASFEYNNAEIRSLIGGADALMMLPLSGLASEAVHVDLTLPEVVSITLSDTALAAGEDADVTVVLSEPVRQLDVSYFSVQHGSLSAFTTTDNVTWHAVYTPVRAVEASDLVISLDAARLSDAAGNLGSGVAQSAAYSLDSTYPEIEIRSDTAGVARGDVRFIVNFSEAVSGFTVEDLKVVNGTIVPFSFDGPNAEGEYSVMVSPLAGSRQPIKVSLGAGAAADEAGNLSRASSVFVQPVDTDAPRIEKIAGVKGSYALGDTISIDVTFTEAVTLQLEPELSEHVLPHLSLNNGQEAIYVAGSGGKTWTFEYVVSTPEDVTQFVDRETLKVLALVENDTSLLDAAGNKLEDYLIETDAQLNAGLSVDTTGAVITGFSSVDGTYKTDDVLYIRAHLSELVHVQGTAPSLTLSNGGHVTYLSGTGSSQLMFRYIVDAADGNAADLSVVSFNAPDAGLVDRAGNVTDLSIVAGENDLAAAHQIVVDTQAPELTGVRLVEDAGTASDVANDGYYKAGTVLAFEVDFDDAVSVDVSDGTPILTLSNGSIAQYVGYVQNEVDGQMVDDPTKLRFEYAVQEDDINTQLLKVTGLAERGAKITDHAGNRAYVEVNDDQLNYTTAVVDTVAPTQGGSSDSFAANERGDDLVRTPQTITVTLRSNEVSGFDYSSIDYDALNAQTRGDLGLAVDAPQEDLDAAIVQSIYAAEQAVALSGITVTFAGSRADGNGFALTDLDGDLAATNYRLVANEQGVVDGMAFAVDVDVPDRAMGTLTVSVVPGALEDLALNANADVFSHDQAVDTQTVDFEITPVAGLFIGATSEVKIYDSVGDELSAGYRLDPATGQVVISVEPSTKYPNGYRGPVLVEVIDSDTSPDYIDEFTGQGVSLSNGSASYSMRAVFNVTSPGDVPVTVSPVTELSVKKLFEAATPSLATPLDPAIVDQFNSGIAKIFGLSEIVHTKATVINSALVEQTTGVDVDDFDLTDGVSASEQYGQVLAMLSVRDSQSGSLAATVDELAATIKAISQAGQTTLAITQLGADKLAAALDSSGLDSDLDGAGINRELLDLAYIDEASAAGYGLNLDEAETTDVPVKGAEVGDTVFVQWGVIARPDTDDVLGAPNRFSVVIDASHVQADGSVRVPVPLSVIEKQGDANEVAVSTAVLPAGSVDGDSNPVTTPAESDYRAPVLLTVDIIPPQTTVQAPDPSTPFVTLGDVEGIRGGDDLTVLLNNSADENFKYVLSTEFLNDYAAAISGGATASSALALVADQIPTGLTVSNVVQDAASGTWAFDWSLNLTRAISVAEQTAEAEAIAAGESYTPSATFAVDDERSVFQVQASTADLVGNADADDARNEVIIGSVDDLVDTTEEQSAMDQALNRLSARYGDAAVDTRAEIKTLADAIDGVTALKNSGDPAATSGDLVAAAQTLVLGSGGVAGTPGAVAAGVHTLSIGDQTFAVDLSNSPSPTVADVIDEIAGSEGYADLPYKVGLDVSGNGLAISWKAFGPQPAASSDVAVTSTQSATQLTSTISNSGSLASFAVQSIAVDGETVDGAFVPAAGDVIVAFGGTALTFTVSEGDSLADALAGLQGDGDYDSLPFRLGVNQTGDGLTATWKATQAMPVTDHITVDRDFEVTTTTEITATIVAAGSAGVTTQELAALDIANVDDSELAAINRALASDLAAVSAPVVSFADSALVAGESTTVSMTFGTRVGQVPDDVMALVGGELSSEGGAGDPIWSTTDGLTWTATFTASSDMPNTALQYAERVDDDGVVVVDANGKAVLDPVVVNDTTDPVTYGRAGDDLSSIALTEALVNRVTDAAAKVAAFADSQGDVPAASPSVQDFADMAVSGVRDDNLSAVQDALGAIRDRFEGEGDLYTQIQTVTNSYKAVFDTVYTPGATTQPSAADLVEDLTNLGVSNLSANSARAEDQMTLLQGALRAVAAAKADITNEDSSVTTAAEQQADMINSVEKLESFVASVEKVLARANGETVDVDGTPTQVAVAAEDLSALGFESLLADTDDNSRLSSLQKVIADQSEGTGSDSIVDYADLKAVLETAVAAFDDIVALTAAAQDTNYVDDAARTQALTAALAEVDADNFQQMGIDGVTDVAIGTLTAAAMADAVKDALSNTGNAINSLESIQQVVDSYRQVLSVASGDVSGDQALISTAQLSDLGVSLSADDEQEPASLATLLSGIIANKAAPSGGATTDNVNSVADIQALADAAKKVFDNANQAADDSGFNAGVADLETLGFDAVDADNIDAVQRVLTRTADRDGVVDYGDLKAKVDAAVDAHAALTDVVLTAQGNGTPDLSGLDETTFTDMGVDHVDAGNVAAMLDALSTVDRAIVTAVDVQTVVDSYNVLLDLGGYDSGDANAVMPVAATASDLTNIGVQLEVGTEDAVAELATGILASLPVGDIDTVAEAQAIVDAIDAVFENTLRTSDDDATHTTVVSKDQLHTLGFAGVDDNNLDAIQRVLSDQTDAADVQSYADLKLLIDNAVTAHANILNAASADDLTDIDEADYAAMGLDGVDADNLSSINDALISTVNTLTTAASVQEVVDSYNHILDLRDAGTGITLNAADFTDLGVTLKATGSEQDQQVAYLQEVVAKDLGNGDIATVSGLQDLANATSDLIDLIQGNSPDSDGVDGLTLAQLALLGVTAAYAEEAGMISARLARTADDLSDVTNLEIDLAARVQEARDALAKIRSYAEGDGVSDADADGTFSPADADDIPTPNDFLNIGVNGYSIVEAVSQSLQLSGDMLVITGAPAPTKTLEFNSLNLIEKFRSVTDDPAQESYYLIDIGKDGAISSDDAELKENINFQIAPSYWASNWVSNENEVAELLENNPDLQIEGVSYDVGIGGWNADAGEHGPIVITWQNGQAIREHVTYSTPRVYIVQPTTDPESVASSVTTSSISPVTRGNEYIFDISDSSLAGGTFDLLDDNGNIAANPVINGVPGQTGALLSFTLDQNVPENLTLKTNLANSGVNFAVSNAVLTPIDTTNIASINELFAATDVGADEGDDPATVRSEIQYVIDQNVGRLGALAKIAAYAQANVLTPADSTLIPDAADFAAAGVSGVTDANNIPALLVKLEALGSSSNAAAADTAAELQGFVKQVAIEKIKEWTYTDGGNGSAPILQDYLNADLVSYDDAAITEAMVPSLNELFAGTLTTAGDADDQAEQQAVIDGAASILAAMAKIADYADADGAIDFSDPADGVNDQLTVADFEAAGISGVGDGTNVSTGSGTSASTYNNLEAVLSKLAQSDIAYLNADTVGEVQQLVADVAVEKINAYADADGVLGLVNETIVVYVDVKTSDHPEQGGSTSAFYLDNVEAPALDLKAGIYTFDQSEPSNANHPLNIYANGDKSGTLPAGITVTQIGTPGQAGAQTVVAIDPDFSGTVSYQCESHAYMGNSAEVAMPYFTPELQDYTNAGLVEDSTADPAVAINANQIPFVNALFERSDVGGTLVNSDTYHADTQANQQDAIDQFGASMLALEKFVDYMLTENSVVKADITAQDFVDAGLARVDVTNYSAILDRLPAYETSDTLVRNDLDSVEKIQAFVSRVIIAEYNADQANQAPVGDDYVAAGITGADADNAAAMNYQVANNGAYADTIAALEGLVTPADAAITKLATDDLSHIDPISNDSQITIGRSHDGSSFVPHALELSDFGDYVDPSSDALASIKVTTLPAAGVIALDGSAITAGASISVQDINDGKLTYTPADTTGAVSLEYAVIDDQGNESAVDYILSIDRLDASPAIGIANSGLLQTDAAIYSSPIYVGDALTGFDGMSSLRVVISATGGNVKINSADLSASGASQIATGFAYATTGGDEICIEGTEAQINAALKALRTQITSGQEKVDISIDVQPGGIVYNPYNGHYYEYVANSGITWTSAKTAAEGRTFEGMTGYLATPTSAEENAFIAAKVNVQAWIGAGDPNTEGHWEWLTGPEAGTQFWSGASSGSAVDGEYSNWSTNEPNNSGGNEDYAHYLTSGKWNDFAVNNSSIQGYMVEYGGMSGDVSTVKSGVRTLTVYATEALGNVDMTLSDFAQAGVTGVSADNLASVNQVLSTKSSAGTDTNPKLQAIVDETIAAIEKIEDFNNAANGVTSLDETDYAAAGITGVTADNVAAINAAVSALSTGGANTTSEIQAVVSQVRIEAYADATASTSPMPEAPTVADYHAIEIYSVDASNLSAVNTFVFDAAAMLAEDTTEIALLVQEALELQPLLDAVAKISTYADANGVGVAAPILDDYVEAQLTGVTQYNVGMANALFADANVGTGDPTSATTQSDQQSVLTAAAARLASYSKIVSYADNDAGPQPTLTDYTNIGLQNFPSDYVSLINAKLVTAGIGIAEVDELSELEALASQIKITEYANANGLAVDGTTALTGDFVPTVNDYANIGVTEIFDGTQMVAVDGSNVEQLNDLMVMRYVGDGARVDVVDNVTDAATNETNLDYAGTVDTASEIEDAIAKAMGDKADTDGGTFGLRAAALDKIAAFAQAVNGLADQAAYDAYIANSNNSAGIPSAQDYNNAGVLDLTDSTAGITTALATAINAKLFTGGATSAVNTVTELQPFVDSANEIVNKIANYANGTWELGATEEDYVDLVYTFANGDFSTGVADGEGFINASNQATTSTTGSFEGWNYIIDQVIPGVDQIGGEAITSPNQGTVASFTYSTTVFNEGGRSGDLFGTFNTSNGEHISVDTVSTTQADGTTGSVLQLQMDIDHFRSNGTNSSGGARAIYYGPAVYSQETYILSPGDRISLDWRALSGGSYGNDASAVVGYLAKVGGAQDGSDNILLVKYADRGSTTWSSVLDGGNQYVEIGANDGGEYFFVFMAGSAETDGTTNPGTQVGSTFEIDNIKLTTASGQAPIEFNGITFEGGNVTQKSAQQVFDRDTGEGTGFVTASASDGTPAVLGWKDDGTFDKEPAVLQSVRLTSSKLNNAGNASSGFNNSVLPKRFVVEGWDQSQNAWVEIQSFDDDSAISTDFSVTGQSYLEFDITSDQAFTGFRVKVYESFGGDGTIEISELDFMAKPANQTAGVLTRPDFEAIGITGVTDTNLSAINAGLFGLPDASSVSMLPGIQAHVNRVSAALQRITDFANSDGAGDTDNNFTNNGSETAVPTVADFNAIGLHFYRTADGRYHEITDDNIAAINEILALAAIGDGGGDLPAATFENVKTIFETEAYTKRLVAIEKISQIVDNSTISVTLLDDTGTPTVSANQTISLVLNSVFATETVSATIGTAGDWSWSSIAISLSQGLATNSGFTISSVAGGIKVERADGQAFSVKGSGSADDFALSVDGASPAVSIGAASSAALTGIASVAGSEVQLTVADFSDAGVSGVTASNIEATLQKLIAVGSVSDIDTALELSAAAFPPDQTITIDSISVDAGASTSDFITSDDDGLTVSATLSAQLEAGQTLEYSNDDGVSWTDITSSVSGTAVSYVDASLTASATIQMKVANVLGFAGTPVSQPITIDTDPPSAPSITLSGKILTITGEAGSGVRILNGTNDISSDFTVTETASGVYEAVAKPGSFAGTETLSLAAKLVDTAGNVGAASSVVTGAIDTTAPSAPALSLSGKTVTVTGDAGGSVKIFNGGSDVTDKFTISEASGTYSAVANAAEFTGSETLSLTATITDASGNESAAQTAVVGTIDTTSPTFFSSPSGLYFDTTGTENYFDEPKITQLSNGEYVVGWRAITTGNPDISLYTQRLNTNGEAIGSAIKHDSATYTADAQPQFEGQMSIISLDTDGTYAVVWGHDRSTLSNNAPVSFQEEITTQVVRPDDTLETAHILTTASNTDRKLGPSVLEYASGKFIVAYANGTLDSTDDTYSNVKAAFFNKDGTLDTAKGSSGYLDLDAAFDAATINTSLSGPLIVKQPGTGHIIFAWPEHDGTDFNIAVSVFDVSIPKFLTKVVLDYGTGGDDSSPQIITKSDGSFAVVWESTDGTDTTTTVAQPFNSAGSKLGDPATISGSDPQVLNLAETSPLGAIAYRDGTNLKVSAFTEGGFSTGVTLTNAVSYITDQRTGDQLAAPVDLVEMAGGKFAVAYVETISNGKRIAIQKFNADGTFDGSAIALPDGRSFWNFFPQLSYDADDGSLLVIWDHGQENPSATPGGETNGIWLHKVLSDGSIESTNTSFSFGAVLDYTEAGSDQTLSVFTSGVENDEAVTLALNGKTYTGTISSDTASISVPTADLASLASGTVTYTVDVDDAAGNSATQFSGSFVKNGISFAGIDVDSNGSRDFTDPSATAGTDESGDGTIDVVLDVSDAVAGDVYELYIDGTLVNTGGTSITQTDINSGTVTAAGVDITGNDSVTAGTGVNANADEVLIELKLKSGGSYITDGTDTQWDYQY